MAFYNLNIKHYETRERTGKRVSHAALWLGGRGRASIFFGATTIADILEKGKGGEFPAGKEGFEFCRLGQDSQQWANTVIATVDEGTVWLYRPAGLITEELEPNDLYCPDIPKSFPIEILAERPVSQVPLVLASMRVSQAFSRSTFRKIAWGGRDLTNALAIAAVLGWTSWPEPLPESFTDLDCLSSLELETLVAKLFESRGCFVPAYKGGTMAGIDLVAHNDQNSDVTLGDLLILAGESRSVQIKRRVDGKTEEVRGNADFLVTLDDIPETQKDFGRKWLDQQLAEPESRTVRSWLRRCARWSDSVRGGTR